MAAGIAGFNLGIETMQLVVVLVTMPWLILLSTTRLYPGFRILGASFAAVAAIGWMVERATNLDNPIGPVVEGLAAHAPVIVTVLAAVSVLAWSIQSGGVPHVFRLAAQKGLRTRSGEPSA